MDVLQQLKNIYATLNQIEIKGDSNIVYMYGSLSVLKEVILSLENCENGGDKDDVK